MSFSYIITHRGKDGRRLANLYATIKWISQFKEHDIEIIVIEQDTEKTFQLNENVKHILAYNSTIFSRAWGLNVGANIATKDRYIFGDSDIIHNYDEFNSFLYKFSNEFKDCDVVSPYNSRVLFLNEEDSAHFRNTLQIKTLLKVPSGRSPLMGGVCVMTRNCFIKTNGWDENFVGWGGEDSAYAQYLYCGNAKIKFDNCTAYHLYHERDKKGVTEYRKAYINNKNYYIRVYHKKSKNHIESNRIKNTSIGNINKYK